MRNPERVALTLAISAVLASCVGSPSGPAGEPDRAPLAASFEDLANEMQSTDVERSEEFRWAAIAVRAGVRPSPLKVTNNGVPEVYDAFVHSVSWPSPAMAIRPVAHRNLIAWRRTEGMLQIIQVSMASDSAPVRHPFSMRPVAPGGASSPMAGARAGYFERLDGEGNSWVGIGGWARVAEHPSPALCETERDRPNGIRCHLTRYGVKLNVLFAEAPSRDSREPLRDALTRRVVADEQVVSGVKLVFSCSEPEVAGCP